MIADLLASDNAIEAAHQERVVSGVPMANGGDDGQHQSLLFQTASGGCPPDAAASPDGGVLGDSLGLGRRAEGEDLPNPLCHREDQLPVLLSQVSGATFALAFQNEHFRVYTRRAR